MVDLPWRGRGEDAATPDEESIEREAVVVSCECQDGTLLVTDDAVHIRRSSRSKFADRRIDLAEVRDVVYAPRLVIGYVQIEQAGFETDEASRLSTPVDENTVHFGRGKRACAERASDAILERVSRG
jgi:hypothetical protein